MIVTDRIF